MAGIEAFRDLRYLELGMVRGLEDLSLVISCESLEELLLQALKNVVSLPDLSSLTQLTRVHLETMKGLTNLRPLLTASALEQVWLIDMGHMQPRASHDKRAYLEGLLH